MTVITNAQRRSLYGPVINYSTGPGVAQSCIVPVVLGPIRTQAHRLIADHLRATLAEAIRVSGWHPAQLQGFNPRPIRGTEADPVPSMHSFALAWDTFDSLTPADVWGPASAPPAAFLDVFRAAGFRCGADFTHRKDYPHIEWAQAPADIPTTHTPTPEDDPPMTPEQSRQLAEVHNALFKGAPGYGVLPIATAVTRTAYEVTGVETDPKRPTLRRWLASKLPK